MSDALQELEQMLPEVPATVERRRLGETLDKTNERLSDADHQVHRLVALLEIAKETEFDTDSVQAEMLNELVAAARESADAMLEAETAEDLKEVQDAYSAFIKALANVERQLRPHWRGIVERDFKPLVAIGGLLQRIDATKDLGGRLISCGQDAERSVAATTADLLREAIHRLRENRTQLEADRASATNEPEVDAFLNALAEGRATLRMVTERVRSWLEHNEALDTFAVTAQVRL